MTILSIYSNRCNNKKRNIYMFIFNNVTYYLIKNNKMVSFLFLCTIVYMNVYIYENYNLRRFLKFHEKFKNINFLMYFLNSDRVTFLLNYIINDNHFVIFSYNI